MAVAGGLLSTAGVSLLLLTGFPSGLSADAGTSEALAELAARSPGARIGGMALKAKTKRAAPLALGRKPVLAPADSPAAAAPMASVMSAGPAPLAESPTALETMPGALIAPAAPQIAAVPGAPVGFVPGPGGLVIGPGGGGGGTPGGGGAIVPGPTPTPTPTSTPPVVVPTPTPTPTTPPVAAVPEPGTWLTLILGFGVVGGALRKRRRVRRLA